MNYTQLSQQIHAAQVAKGFYDEKKSDAQIVALIISELYEMFDCHRKNKMLNPDQLQPFLNLKEWGEYDVQLFERTCKTTFEFEFVDVLIRLLDFAGYRRYKLNEKDKCLYVALSGNFFDDILEMNKWLQSLTDKKRFNIKYPFSKLLVMLLKFAKKYGIDFEPLISIKLAYSATLPYKHGKRY